MAGGNRDFFNRTQELILEHDGILSALGDAANDGNFMDPNQPPTVKAIALQPLPPPGQDNSNLNVIIPAVACICLIIFIVALIGFFVYRKQKGRWKEIRETSYSQNEADTIAMDSQKNALFQNDPLGDFFQNKEGTVSQDVQSALNFLATPFVCDSFSDSKTNLSQCEQASLSLENEINRETGGVGVGDVRGGVGSPAAPGILDWSLPDSDVVVKIPAGTLPCSANSQNSLKVALGANPLNVVCRNDQIQLSSLLILASPNMVRFNKSIEVCIPHRAHLTTESTWTLQLRYSGTTQNNINKLDWLDGTQDKVMDNVNTDADVTYHYDTDFVYISSYVPGLFCVVGCGACKKKPLKVAVMVFAYPLPPQTCNPEPSQGTGNCGIDIKVFFIDNLREAIQHLRKTEEEAGGLCISEPLLVRMVNEKDWEVILVSADTPQWPYHIQDGQKVKVLPSDVLYKDFGLGVSVDFRIFSKMPRDGGLDRFQATFSLAQRRRNPSNVVASLLTTQTLLVPHSADSIVGSSISRESDNDPSSLVPQLHKDLLDDDILTPPPWLMSLSHAQATSTNTVAPTSNSITTLQDMT